MGYAEVKAPYEEVAAYYESMGIALYTDNSYGDETTLFTIYWNESGFTGGGWLTQPEGGIPSPTDGYVGNEEALESMDESEIARLIQAWAREAEFEEKLAWLGQLSSGCGA